jgi:FMNH2-dependent dimethyl sulfone monooxygenase
MTERILDDNRSGARRNPTMFNRNRLKLGLFAPNCSSGQAITRVPERWDASWENNRKLAQMADDAGLECLVPIGRWKGYGGETDFEGSSFETITWACGLLAVTRDITIFGTVHCPLIHPVLAAKLGVTADHAGEGRFGLNIVCGWNLDEFKMFGARRHTHDRRYEYGQEWWDIVSRIWSGEGPFDYHGEFFRLEGIIGKPVPWGGRRPIVMNAGTSLAGRRFAARNSDFHFDHATDPAQMSEQIADTRRLARTFGHEIGVFTAGFMVCRPTRREAEDYLHYFAEENADFEAVDRLLKLASGGKSNWYSPEAAREMRIRFAAGYGSTPFVGDPDDVARELKRLADIGFDGIVFSLVNYLDELPFVAAEVLPRLERMGLRKRRE